MAFVEMKDVYKRYRTGEIVTAASDGINFTIEKGEFAIIVGPSGAGKTTVLNILGGMDTADEGQVLVDGNDIVQYTPKQLIGYRRHDIGFVFQFYNLVQNLTALENVELAAQICHDPIPAAEALEAVADKAIERNIGARGLRAVMEGVLTPIMYDIPSDHTIEQVTITAGAVNDGAAPVILRDPSRGTKNAPAS